MELLDRALAACAHRAQRRMPAEIRQIEARAKGTPATDSPASAVSYALFIDVDRRHRLYALQGQRFSWMCRSKSPRKYFRALCSGSAAPGARRRRYVREPEVRMGFQQFKIGGWPRPFSMSCNICSIQESPLQHGVHQPHDSWAKKCSRLSTCQRDRSCHQGQSWCRCRGGCRLSASNRNPSPRRGGRQ